MTETEKLALRGALHTYFAERNTALPSEAAAWEATAEGKVAAVVDRIIGDHEKEAAKAAAAVLKAARADEAARLHAELQAAAGDDRKGKILCDEIRGRYGFRGADGQPGLCCVCDLAQGAVAAARAEAEVEAGTTPEGVEKLAEAVHDAYLATCARLGWRVATSNRVPYAALSEAAKELDRASVRAVLVGLRRPVKTLAAAEAGAEAARIALGLSSRQQEHALAQRDHEPLDRVAATLCGQIRERFGVPSTTRLRDDGGPLPCVCDLLQIALAPARPPRPITGAEAEAKPGETSVATSGPSCDGGGFPAPSAEKVALDAALAVVCPSGRPDCSSPACARRRDIVRAAVDLARG